MIPNTFLHNEIYIIFLVLNTTTSVVFTFKMIIVILFYSFNGISLKNYFIYIYLEIAKQIFIL